MEKRLDPRIVNASELIGDKHAAFTLINLIKRILESTHRATFDEYLETDQTSIFKMRSGDDTLSDKITKSILPTRHSMLNSYQDFLYHRNCVDIIILLNEIIDKIDVAYYQRTITELKWSVESLFDTNYASTYKLIVNRHSRLDIVHHMFILNDMESIIFMILIAMGLMDRVDWHGVFNKNYAKDRISNIWLEGILKSDDVYMKTVFSNLRWLEHHLDMGFKLKKTNGKTLMVYDILEKLINKSTELGENEATMFLLRYGEEHDLHEKRKGLRL